MLLPFRRICSELEDLFIYAKMKAQLAGVIAHEIGRITARHTAKDDKNFGVGLLANILGVINKNIMINDLINTSCFSISTIIFKISRIN